MACPLDLCHSKKMDQTGVCINTTCLLRQNSLPSIGITECLVCLASTECFMQPICTHYLCTPCIRKVYYLCDIEDIATHLREIHKGNPEEMADRLKEYEYTLTNQAVQIKELRLCPMCRR